MPLFLGRGFLFGIADFASLALLKSKICNLKSTILITPGDKVGH